MNTRREIAELRRRLDELEQRLDPLPKYVASDQVVRFRKRFGGKSFTYAAVKVGVSWYTTGRDNAYKRMSDEQFRRFIEDATSIEIATSWERLDA